MALLDLPDIELIGTDVTDTLNNVLAVHSAITGRTLAPADPERLLLQSLSALIVQQRVLINSASKANYLRFASGVVLDHIGALTRTTRLQPAAAQTTLRFQLSALQLSTIAIPVGTRVSSLSDPKRYFQTIAYAEVPAGSMTVDVPAVCTETGAQGNGYVAGQVSAIVDPIAFVANAANITKTAGGVDVEGDDAYRQRIYEAPESMSVAGPEGAYKYWAKTASALIVDVSVTSPAAVEVVVVPLLAGGEIPGTEIIEAVEDILQEKRPLTDQVTVQAPTTTTYDVELTYWIKRSDSGNVLSIQAAVTKAANDYIVWQKSKLGRDINPSELIHRVMSAGASRITVADPVYTIVAATAVALGSTPVITYGGLSDD